MLLHSNQLVLVLLKPVTVEGYREEDNSNIVNISFKKSTTFIGGMLAHKDYCNRNGSVNIELKSHLVIGIIEEHVKFSWF